MPGTKRRRGVATIRTTRGADAVPGTKPGEPGPGCVLATAPLPIIGPVPKYWMLVPAGPAVPTTAPTTTTIVQPVTTTTAPVAESGGTLTGLPPFLACVAWRESRDTPTAVNPSSGAGGLFQFLPSTWSALGYPGLPENASVADQIAAAEQLYAEQGAAPWAGGSYSC